MKIPFSNFFNRYRKAPILDHRQTGGFQLRPNYGQGPYTQYFNNYIARKVEPWFFEFLREAIPIIDAAINRLVSLDGHIEVAGQSEALKDEIQDWMDNINVNDVQRGLQAFHQSLTNEGFEQGFGLGEFVANQRRNDIVQLRTADSKYIKFRRISSGLEILQKSDEDHEYRPLDPVNLIYFSINNENQNPYGTPLMRSCEFVSKTLVTIQNSLLNVWERFGDPSFNIIYKTSKKDGADHESRRKKIEKEFNTAIRAKREGKSADFIRAIDKDSEITIEVIGHDNQVLELEVPARHVVEQIVAKTGLPPWMLGLHWSTTERLSNAEAEMLLADVATRQAAKMPMFTNLVSTMLKLRGRRWKKGDWYLQWANVNIHDVVSQARARFLNAQADMYYLQNAEAAGIEISREDLSIGKNARTASHPDPAGACGQKTLTHIHCKETQRPYNWPAVDQLEFDYETRLKDDWQDLLVSIKAILGLEMPKMEKADDAFSMTTEQRAQAEAAMKEWIAAYATTADDSPINWFYGQAVSQGYFMAADMTGEGQPILDIIKNKELYNTLRKQGFDLVKNNATKAIVNKILPEMEAYVIAGANPTEVGRRLEQLFGAANSNWERLARSEMTMAAELAKHEEWRAWEVSRLDFVPAPDACGMCMAMAGEYGIEECPVPVRDTHPRCRCATRPAEKD